MYTYDFHKRIRYAETDQMGYLYYGRYATLYEIGRVETMRSIGISYRQLEMDMRVMMPVVEVQSRFLRPVKYDELITIRTVLTEVPTKMITFEHEILSPEGAIVHRGTVKLFFIDMDTDRRVSAPSHLISALKPYF